MGGLPALDNPRSRTSRVIAEHSESVIVWSSGEYMFEHTFSVVNDSGESVYFVDTRTSCSCSTVQLAKHTLAPAEETTLRVEMKTSSGGGTRVAQCVLIDNRGTPWVYRLRGIVYSPLQVAGKMSYLDLGILESGQPAGKRVEVYTYAEAHDEPDHPVITAAGVEGLKVLTDDQGLDTLGGRVCRRTTAVDVILPAQGVVGAHNAQVSLAVSGCDRKFRRTLHVTWRVRSPWVVSPSRVVLRLPEGSASAPRQEIRVRRLDGRPWKVGALRASHPGVVVEEVVQAATSMGVAERVIAVTVDPTHWSDWEMAHLIVKPDDPEQAALRIHVLSYPSALAQ